MERRKTTVLYVITLDEVMQAHGGPEEDTSSGFKFGGCTAPYCAEAYGKAIFTSDTAVVYIINS